MRIWLIGTVTCIGVVLSTLTMTGPATATPATSNSSASGSISASPNPARLGKTTIKWRSTSSTAAVFVSEDGHAESLFAASASGSSVAAFVAAGHKYRFDLYPSRHSHIVLASVVVTGATGIGASPNPAPDGKTTITWQSTRSSAVVRVSVDGRGDALFAAGADGTSVASFIAAGASYRFSVYGSSYSHTALASVVVKR